MQLFGFERESTNLSLDDDSYRAAKKMVESGSLGEIHAVETTCLDQQDPTGKESLALPDILHANAFKGFFVSFSAQSGGIFVDMGVHDVSRSSLATLAEPP